MFDPRYQPWTGGGTHFSFMNQPKAAEQNYHMFFSALLELLEPEQKEYKELQNLRDGFAGVMQAKMFKMWATKLGLERFDVTLFNELVVLMIDTSVDYTLFFRELSKIPESIAPLAKSFYGDSILDERLQKGWSVWLEKWHLLINATTQEEKAVLSKKMCQVNPKYTLREWFLLPAYGAAQKGEYGLIHELQEVMSHPYDELSSEVEEKFYREKPSEFFERAGISHVSCSS